MIGINTSRSVSRLEFRGANDQDEIHRKRSGMQPEEAGRK